MKTNESARQLYKRSIGLTELFPANQETTPAIEPGKQPFDDPPSRRFARFQVVGSVLRRLILLLMNYSHSNSICDKCSQSPHPKQWNKPLVTSITITAVFNKGIWISLSEKPLQSQGRP